MCSLCILQYVTKIQQCKQSDFTPTVRYDVTNITMGSFVPLLRCSRWFSKRGVGPVSAASYANGGALSAPDLLCLRERGLFQQLRQEHHGRSPKWQKLTGCLIVYVRNTSLLHRKWGIQSRETRLWGNERQRPSQTVTTGVSFPKQLRWCFHKHRCTKDYAS